MSGKTNRIRATRLTLLSRGATASNQQPRFSSDEPLLAKELERATRLARALPAFEDVLHAPEASAANGSAIQRWRSSAATSATATPFQRP